MTLSALTRKSWTDLTRRRARAVFAIATMAVAVASVGVFALTPLMSRAMQSEVRANRLYDVVIQTPSMPLSQQQLQDIGRLPNIKAVVARPWFATRAYIGTKRVQALVVGIPDPRRQPVDRITVSSGRQPGPGTVLTDADNATQRIWGGKVGDTVRIVTATGGVKPMRVSGVGRGMIAGDATFNGTLVVYATSDAVAELTGGHRIGLIELRLNDTGKAAAQRAVADVRDYLVWHTSSFRGFTNLPVIREPGTYPAQDMVDKIGQLFYVITLLALVSGLFLIANTMSTLVTEQTSEIGMMKAIGGRRRQIAMAYVRTALIMGGIGTLIGVPLGVGLSNLLTRFFAGSWYGVTPGFAVDTRTVVASVALGLVGPVLACLPAIRKATAVPVRQALTTGAGAPGSDGAIDRALRRVRFLPKAWQIGLRSMGRAKRRTLGTAFLVALAVANLLGLLSLGAGVARSTHLAFKDMGYDIALGTTSGGGTGRPLDSTAARIVAHTRGVAAVEPYVQTFAKLAGKDVQVWGVAPRFVRGGAGAEGSMPPAMLTPGTNDGRWFTPAEEQRGTPVAVLGVTTARATGAHIGDRVTIDTGAGPVLVRVVGTSASEASIMALYMPLRSTQKALALGATVNGYFVRTTSDSHAVVDRTTTRLEDRLSAHGYPASGARRYDQEARSTAFSGRITQVITMLGFLVIGISMIGLINTLTANVLERTREIGVMRCIGGRRRDIRRIFASEGLAVSLLGWAVGVPLGYGAAKALVRVVTEIMNMDLAFTFPPFNLVLALSGTIVLALLVMRIPLRRATRFHAGDALRYQ
jgi:putative ABC transport system permease protein